MQRNETRRDIRISNSIWGIEIIKLCHCTMFH